MRRVATPLMVKAVASPPRGDPVSSPSSVSANGHGRSAATGPRIAVALVSAIAGIAIVVVGASVLATTPAEVAPPVFRHVPVPPSLRSFAGLPAPQGGPPGAYSWLVTPGNVGRMQRQVAGGGRIDATFTA